MYHVQPVAIAHTPFQEKFAIPRQPGLAPSAVADICLLAPFDKAEALDGLETASHIWLTFLFHKTPVSPRGSLKVRPPRLGGNQKLGVFATRSNFRPNGIGQSVVRLTGIEGIHLTVSGIDLLDQTPILDIKPYIPYSDSVPEANSALAPTAPARLSVQWHPDALLSATFIERQNNKPLVSLIEECLAQDPRPAYQPLDTDRVYGTCFWHNDVQWRYLDDDTIEVIRVQPQAAG